MQNILKIGIILVSLFLTSCSENDGDITNTDISSSNLSGTVYGESFNAVGGKAFDSGNTVSINITNEEANCDGTIFDYNYYISSTFILQLGTYEGLNIVFHKAGETPRNYIGAVLEVTSFTDSTITVKIKAESGTDNTVEGVFTVDYCK